MSRKVHELLTEDPLVSDGPIGRAYQTQVRRVRELFERLREVDPDWAREWQEKERGQRGCDE